MKGAVGRLKDKEWYGDFSDATGASLSIVTAG